MIELANKNKNLTKSKTFCQNSKYKVLRSAGLRLYTRQRADDGQFRAFPLTEFNETIRTQFLSAN